MKISALVLSFSVFICGIASAAPPPNVILIISDDQGFGDYGFMGSKDVRTPNLDRMASQSQLYTRGYVMPVCSPSLACLLTGRLPHENGITGNDLAKSESGPKPSDRSPLVDKLLSNKVLLPKVLSEAGYLTFQTGKLWNVTYKEVGFSGGMTAATGRHGGDGLKIGRESMQPIYDFIEGAKSQNKPFFVWYAPMMPHEPHNPPAQLLAKYQGKGFTPEAEKYYAMVEWFDQSCGELDAYLTQNKLAENTVILYLTDNGWDAARGRKADRSKLSPYELGVRTPMFVRWPGKVAPARDEETLASIIDFVPTILKVSGVNVGGDLPGVNLLDKKAMAARKSVFVESYRHDIADLADPAKSLVARVVVNGWWKLLIPSGTPVDRGFASSPKTIELFDLKTDPLETKNVADEHPDEVKRLGEIQKMAWNVE